MEEKMRSFWVDPENKTWEEVGDRGNWQRCPLDIINQFLQGIHVVWLGDALIGLERYRHFEVRQ